MNTHTTFIRRHPVLTYFLLTFAISWGGFAIAVGPRGFTSLNWELEAALLPAVLATFAGPSLVGILLTAFLDGRAGLREMASRLAKWRVGRRWYAIALLPAPLLSLSVLAALWLRSPIFLAENRMAVLVACIAASLTTVLEEIGWTGFALPRLRRRYSPFATGLIIGALWGGWHLLQQIWISGTYSNAMPFALYLTLSFLSVIVGLTAYRVLMVWVYEHTASLLVLTLMHASLTASHMFLFRPVTTGVSLLIYEWVFSAALWVVVAVVVVANQQQLTRQPLRPLAA
jgi:CAAX protease family protein